MRPFTRLGLAILLSIGAPLPALALTITPNFTNGTALQKSQVTQAVTDWLAVLGDPAGETVNLTLNVTFMDLGATQGGNSLNFVADANDNPKTVDIQINTNASLMFYDATLGTSNDIPVDRRDALGVARHEIGHALGFSANPDGYTQWDACLTGGTAFDCNGVTATLAGTNANGLSHLDATAHPGDLMNLTIGLGPQSRRSISQLDLDMLCGAFGYSCPAAVPEPSTAVLLGLGMLLLASRAIALGGRL
jgi:PEP-CTERM motif